MGIILDLLEKLPLTIIMRERIKDLEKKMAATEAALKQCESEKQALRLQIEEIKKEQAIMGDKCPYCQHHKGELFRLTPHPIFGEVGVKVGIYKCANCGKEYDREHQP